MKLARSRNFSAPRRVLFAAAGLIACFPSAPCACPPATSLFRVYGTVLLEAGSPAVNATVAATAPWNSDCSGTDREELQPTMTKDSRTGPDGAFDVTFRSVSGLTSRCLRLVAYAGAPGASDSVVVPDMVVQFRYDRLIPDSVAVELRLP